MKARREENGQIRTYGELPSKFKGVTGNYAGGFHRSDPEVFEEEGFFDIVEPVYNRVLQTLSPIYFDEENKIFTYDVIEKPDLPTLDQAKIDKIKELKEKAREKFSETDWYYIRELHTDKKGKKKDVPVEIIDEKNKIYALIDQKEQLIKASISLEEILTFNINLEKNSDEELKKLVDEKLEEEPVPPEEPPTEEPPAEEPPVEPETSPEEPLTEEPPAEPETSPEEPLTEEPPAEPETPPAEEPPAETPPAVEEPPVEEPPAE